MDDDGPEAAGSDEPAGETAECFEDLVWQVWETAMFLAAEDADSW